MSRVERTVALVNKMGLHARPSTLIKLAADKFPCDIWIIKEGQEVDAKSVIELLMLAAECGSELTVRAEGPQAAEAVEALTALIGRGFDHYEVDH